MLICRKKRYLKFSAEHEYVTKILGHSNPKNFKQSDSEMQSKNALMVMTEHDEIANNLIDENCGKILRQAIESDI